ncbi:TIGR03617 family F420-dependent LLM class oxidoreductase [Streptomyces fulvoviolaceus]|uniref:TIGR03617 family F420-dependent LLM class oxidoreductase n=1 Tax=Streptomyces fulvoviolaceus TaxID=285535 RepID=UPI000694AB23|nr:TIGR03617 family F420-dependent LLM class oxidoreductase [Streptomyces fulvoviolaceus]
MQVDGRLTGGLADARAGASALEDLGYDSVLVPEVAHDGLLPVALAADGTSRITLGTSILVAFARSPMSTAMAAWDLQRFSGGRLQLGLGSQVRPHIERRFAMPWSRPAERMSEYVSALHAIWQAWQEGTPLDFRGDFTQHTLMPPRFDPGPLDVPPPAVFVAAVGPRMTEATAQVADGLILHSFTTARYVREVTQPAIDRGLAARGRDRSSFEVRASPFVVTDPDGPGRDQAIAAVRDQIAFYASTPSYRPVLELHGWGDLQTELSALSRQGRWAEMGALIDDEVFGAFVVVAEPEGLGEAMRQHIGSYADRVGLTLPQGCDPDWHAGVVRSLKETAAAPCSSPPDVS